MVSLRSALDSAVPAMEYPPIYPDESKEEQYTHARYIDGFNRARKALLDAADLLDLTVSGHTFVLSKEQWDAWWNSPGKGFPPGMQEAMAKLVSGRYVVLDRGETK